MSQVEAPRWYVVYSKPRKEEHAQVHLRAKGIEVFFPKLLLPKSARKPQRVVSLFPNYLFVRIVPSQQYYSVMWSPGVKYIVRFNNTLVPLDDDVVGFLMQRVTPDGVIEARSNLRFGQEVRITSGAFAGLIGLVLAPPDARGRVKVLLSLLSRQVSVQLPVRLLDSDWVLEPTNAGSGAVS